MFIKRKTRLGKAYAYRMILSFKTLVTFMKFWTTVPVVKQLPSYIFTEHCPMPGANIQACILTLLHKLIHSNMSHIL